MDNANSKDKHILCLFKYFYKSMRKKAIESSNLLSFLLRCGTRPYMNEAPNETRTHSCKFASLTSQPLTTSEADEAIESTAPKVFGRA